MPARELLGDGFDRGEDADFGAAAAGAAAFTGANLGLAALAVGFLQQDALHAARARDEAVQQLIGHRPARAAAARHGRGQFFFGDVGRVLDLARQVGLAVDAFDQPHDRRARGRRGRPKRRILRLVGDHRHQRQIAQHPVPRGDIFAAIPFHQVAVQTLQAPVDIGRAGLFAQHPLVLAQLFADHVQLVEEIAPETFIGIQRRHRQRGQITAIPSRKDLRGRAVDFLNQLPFFQIGGVDRPVDDQRIGLFVQRQLGDGGAGAVDGGLIQRHQRRAAVIQRQHGVQMRLQPIGEADAFQPRIFLRPSLVEPGLDGGIVGRLALLAQQQIDLQRAVNLRHLARGDDLRHPLFQIEDQPRPQHPFQGLRIGVGGDRVQPLALTQAHAFPDAGILTVAIPRRHGFQIIQQRRHWPQIGVRDHVAVQLVHGGAGIALGFGLGGVHQAEVLPVAIAKRPRQPQRGKGDGRQRGGADQQRALHRLAVMADPALFGDHHPLQQVMDEEAFAAPRHEGGGEGGGAVLPGLDRAQHLVDRRAFLRPRGEVEAAQNGVGLVARGFEHPPQEVRDVVAQQRHLARQAEDRDARDAVGFFRQTVGDLVRQAGDEAVELGRDGFMGDGLAVGGLEGGAPDQLAAALAETGEIFAETGDQVGLGEHHINREVDLQPFMQFGQTGAHGFGVAGQRFGAFGHHVLDREGQDHPVDRLVRPGLFQQVQKRVPAGLVSCQIAVLGGVTPGGVDQDRVLGEPEIHVPGAAKARDGLLLRQRKLHPRIGDGGGLTGTGRPDDDIPRQIIERAGTPRFLQNAKRFLHLFGQDLAVAFRLKRDQRGLDLARGADAAAPADEDHQEEDAKDQPDQRRAQPHRRQRPPAGHRPADPDGGAQPRQPEDGHEPAPPGMFTPTRKAQVIAEKSHWVVSVSVVAAASASAVSVAAS